MAAGYGLYEYTPNPYKVLWQPAAQAGNFCWLFVHKIWIFGRLYYLDIPNYPN
jgi:hypothetical protein